MKKTTKKTKKTTTKKARKAATTTSASKTPSAFIFTDYDEAQARTKFTLKRDRLHQTYYEYIDCDTGKRNGTKYTYALYGMRPEFAAIFNKNETESGDFRYYWPDARVKAEFTHDPTKDYLKVGCCVFTGVNYRKLKKWALGVFSDNN